MEKKICIIGNIVADFIAAEISKLPEWGELVGITPPITMNIGGNAAICSVSLSRLGLKPILVGKIGNDNLGSQLRNELRSLGVDVKYIGIDKNSSTSATLALARKDGERIFFHHIGANARLSMNAIKKVPLDGISALLLSSIFILPGIKLDAAEKYLKSVRRKKIPTFLDVAWDPENLWKLNGLLRYVDFFMPNEDELLHITKTSSLDRAADFVFQSGVETLIVKQGPKGCIIFFKGKKHRIMAPKVNAVDATGAGDVFNAGFIFEYLNSQDPLTSAEFAVHAASLSVAKIGGTTSAPDIIEAKKFMKRKGRS